MSLSVHGRPRTTVHRANVASYGRPETTLRMDTPVPRLWLCGRLVVIPRLRSNHSPPQAACMPVGRSPGAEPDEVSHPRRRLPHPPWPPTAEDAVEVPVQLPLLLTMPTENPINKSVCCCGAFAGTVGCSVPTRNHLSFVCCHILTSDFGYIYRLRPSLERPRMQGKLDQVSTPPFLAVCHR